MSAPYHELEARIHELENLLQKSSMDHVSGVANRGALDQEMKIRYSKIQRDQAYAVLFMDIDFFKQVNDSLGHCAGDAVLKHVCDMAKSMMRPADFIGRFGGEEFVIITSARNSSVIADRVRRTIAIHTQVTVSIGVYLWAVKNVQASIALYRADKAMYRAKENGRNRVVSYDHTME